METAEEKLTFLANNAARTLRFDEVQPDRTSNWINLTNNDFDSLLPLASKETKAAKTPGKERAIFKMFSLGVATNRDDWVYDESRDSLEGKVRVFISVYTSERERWIESTTRAEITDFVSRDIKWTSELEAHLVRGTAVEFQSSGIRVASYRPFHKCWTYFAPVLSHRPYQQPLIFPYGQNESSNLLIALSGIGFARNFQLLATDTLPDLHFNGDSQCLPLHRYDESGNLHDNITNWGLKQFKAHYAADSASQPPSPQPRSTLAPVGARALRERESEAASSRGKAKAGGKAKPITKEAIFHYCYAVLHDPMYREKYALNLKREFPRIPFYADFWQWAAWGEALMNLHIGYENVAPFALTRADVPDAKAQAAGLAPKAMLRADTSAGTITLDSETTLTGVPPEAWTYKLGNRSALEWILDQCKEKKPKDPTIRANFDTYRFADYKEKVIDLLMRVTTVSVETVAITEAMKSAKR